MVQAIRACCILVAPAVPVIIMMSLKEADMAKNTGDGKRIGLVKNRYQKKNSRTGLWDKYNKRGDYVGTKKTGGPFKAIVRLVGRNPKRG